MITKEQLVDMFAQIRDNTDWDLDGPMVWGYFFTDVSPEKLRETAPLLEAKGYRVIDVFLADKEEVGDPDLWWLHVEKEEVHTPDSLDARNSELYAFAQERQLGAYDGMDVGPLVE